MNDPPVQELREPSQLVQRLRERSSTASVVDGTASVGVPAMAKAWRQGRTAGPPRWRCVRRVLRSIRCVRPPRFPRLPVHIRKGSSERGRCRGSAASLVTGSMTPVLIWGGLDRHWAGAPRSWDRRQAGPASDGSTLTRVTAVMWHWPGWRPDTAACQRLMVFSGRGDGGRHLWFSGPGRRAPGCVPVWMSFLMTGGGGDAAESASGVAPAVSVPAAVG